MDTYAEFITVLHFSSHGIIANASSILFVFARLSIILYVPTSDNMLNIYIYVYTGLSYAARIGFAHGSGTHIVI